MHLLFLEYKCVHVYIHTIHVYLLTDVAYLFYSFLNFFFSYSKVPWLQINMVPRSHRTQPHSSLQQDVEKPYFLKEHYTAAPPTSWSDQPQTVISLEQHSTAISQGVGDAGLTACLRWEGSAERSITNTRSYVNTNGEDMMKSSQEKKSCLAGIGKSIPRVENYSQYKIRVPKNSQVLIE